MDDQGNDRKGRRVIFGLHTVLYGLAILVFALMFLVINGPIGSLVLLLIYSLLAPLHWLAWRFVPESDYDKANRTKK